MIEVITESATEVVAEGDGQEVLVEVQIVTEVVTEQSVEVLTEVGPVEILIETPDPEVITETQVVAEVLEVAIQGPPGPPGKGESSPVFTYSDGQVTRIDYASGNYKLFSYTSGVLTKLDYVQGSTTVRKTFTYNPDGTLASISQTVI